MPFSTSRPTMSRRNKGDPSPECGEEWKEWEEEKWNDRKRWREKKWNYEEEWGEKKWKSGSGRRRNGMIERSGGRRNGMSGRRRNGRVESGMGKVSRTAVIEKIMSCQNNGVALTSFFSTTTEDH